MFRVLRLPSGTIMALAVCASLSGCTIQDILRATAGGVNSDRATLNKINSANEYSFPEAHDRTVIDWPKPKE